MPLSVFPVVIPATLFVVALVVPLIGSLPAPFAAIRIEATDRQAEYGRADGQEEKTSFHVDSRVRLFEWPGIWSKEPPAISVHAGSFRRNRCCLEKDGFDGSGSPDPRGPKRLAGGVAGFDPIVNLFLNQLFKFLAAAADGPSQSEWCDTFLILNETPAPGWIDRLLIVVINPTYLVA